MLSIRSSMYLTGRPLARARVAAMTITRCIKILLPKLPPARVGTIFSRCVGMPRLAADIGVDREFAGAEIIFCAGTHGLHRLRSRARLAQLARADDVVRL